MVKNIRKVGFDILGQTGVPPVTYRYLAEMAMEWPELMLSKAARGTARKKISILTANRLGWNGHGEKSRKRWV